MKKSWSVVLLAVVLTVLAITDADAQRFNRRRMYNSVGFSLNAMNYFGDITPQADFTSLRFGSTRPNVGIFYARKFHPRISARVGLSWGRIMGNDTLSADRNEADNLPRYKRNLNFRNDIKELSLVGQFDLFENRSTYLRRPDFSPYLFLGVAVFHHAPKGYYEGDRIAEGWYDLQPLGTEGQNFEGGDPYSKIQIAIPFGLGVRYKLDRNWDLGFEIGWRKTFTDFLDDVSGEYVDKSKFTDPTALVMSDLSPESGFPVEVDANGFPHVNGYGMQGDQRGDKSDDDWYIVAGFNLSYILSPNQRAPKFR